MRFYINILTTYFPEIDPGYDVYYRQVLEQGTAGGADDLRDRGQGFEPAQKVVLAEAQQECGRGEGSDGQHEAAAEALHVLQGLAAALRLARRRGARCGIFRGHDVPRLEEGGACAGMLVSVESS